MSLQKGMQVTDDSSDDMRHDCEFLTTNYELPSHWSSLNTLHVPNPLDSHKLADCSTPIQWQIEEQKDPNIMQAIEWLQKA